MRIHFCRQAIKYHRQEEPLLQADDHVLGRFFTEGRLWFQIAVKLESVFHIFKMRKQHVAMILAGSNTRNDVSIGSYVSLCFRQLIEPALSSLQQRSINSGCLFQYSLPFNPQSRCVSQAAIPKLARLLFIFITEESLSFNPKACFYPWFTRV